MFGLPPIVWLLGAFVSIVCAVLLVRAYVFHRVAMLLSSAVACVTVAVGNLMLLFDELVLLESDLLIFRQRLVLVAFSVMLWTVALE